MKKGYISLLIGLFATVALAGCGKDQTPKAATYYDATAESIIGQLSEFDKDPDKVKPGDTLTFKAKPAKYYSIKRVTNNGNACERVGRPFEDGSAIYRTVIQEGDNVIKGEYKVDQTVDFVDEFKLDISDAVFNKVMSYSETGNNEGDSLALDFRKSGIEQCRAPNWYDGDVKKARPKNSKDDFFINYVDGDTTHVETFNLDYTVKIRYLSINTPESTSEIEEWGLSASYYSKYIYSGSDEYRSKIASTTDLDNVKAGITSLILVSQGASMYSSEMTVDDLALDTEEPGKYAATTDGNQRNLAYVWYSTVKNPTKNDFRCLNLEMVYQGFSKGIGSLDDCSEYYYKMFYAANESAKANLRHLYSHNPDPNYHYYEETPIQSLTLKQLYESSEKDSTIGYYPKSQYCNNKTLFTITGYVTRKLKTSFYIQDKPSYTAEEIAKGECYGLYVFTYALTPISSGHQVEVTGVLSSYGGTFQMQGILYSNAPAAKTNPRYTHIIGGINTYHKIVPAKVSGAQLNALKLPQVLVELTDNIWFYKFTSTYAGEVSDLGEGGDMEINKYNTAYPFYNTSNAPIFYGSYGDTDNAKALQDAAGTSGLRYSNDVIRFTLDQDAMVSYSTESSRSYQFFSGGSLIYNQKGAQYANYDEDNPYLALTTTITYERKCHMKDAEDVFGNVHGLICISHGYESTGGNKKMTATICSGMDCMVSAVA